MGRKLTPDRSSEKWLDIIVAEIGLAYAIAPGYPPLAMDSMAEKISRLLRQRGLLKRDLARALGVSPQTATDICKGRSSITVPHLRRLIKFFGLRAEFWLDNERLNPSAADETSASLDAKMHKLAEVGLLSAEDPAGLFERLLDIARSHREEYLNLFGEAPPEERRLLGLPSSSFGTVGRISAS